MRKYKLFLLLIILIIILMPNVNYAENRDANFNEFKEAEASFLCLNNIFLLTI